jgi:hypothetical protein
MGILTDDMKRVVREQKLGFIATVCPDGTPNLSPQNPMRAVALVTVTRALPLISPAYNQGLSEDEMRVIYRRFFAALWSGRADTVGKPE